MYEPAKYDFSQERRHIRQFSVENNPKTFEFFLLREGGKIPLDATDSIPTRRQPGSAELIEPIQQNLPVAKGIEKDRHGPDIEGLRA